jgi:phenol hydroxylase P5 protein
MYSPAVRVHSSEAELAQLVAKRRLRPLGGGGEEAHGRYGVADKRMAHRRKAELVATRMLSPSVRSLVMRTTDGSAVGHVAGQYLDLIVPTARGLAFKRSYSIASPPGDTYPDQFELGVTRVEGGPTSQALHGMGPGATVDIEGPTGTFLRRESDRARSALFVAAGTGLAPIRAMLAEEVRSAEGPPLVLLFGCRTPDDVLWEHDLRAWQRACPRFALHVTLSRPPPEWSGLVGYVQRYARALAESLPGVHAYVCGLTAMVEDVVGLMEREAKLSRKAVHYETYD